MIKNRRQSHIGIATNDIKAITRWFQDVLGCEPYGDFKAPDGTPCIFMRGPDLFYEIYQPVTGVDPAVAGKIDHIAYASEDIAKDYEYCKAQGYAFTTDGIQTIDEFWDNGVSYFKIACPTGQEIEFCQIL
jgi:catechol 2,3-dioxygenase-like lactoylglutathione lyase family enzyme